MTPRPRPVRANEYRPRPPRESRRAPDLARLSDDELLACRFCELPIRLEGTPIAARARRVFDELRDRDLLCEPAIWLAEEWFNPDATVGFAIPFYLAHPRLIRLERKMMLEAEGVPEGEALRILRHETGHAVDEAYQLFRTPEYRSVFGSPRQPYPTSYAVRPDSLDYVTHLNAWYAQSHPVEDFAETFAVWLKPGGSWGRRYRGWPALRKLTAVDEWMRARAGQLPTLASRRPAESLEHNTRTLAQHYEEKRRFYGIDAMTSYDEALARVFPEGGPRAPARGRRRPPSAVRLLKAVRTPLRNEIARPLGVPAYTVDQILRQLMARARALDLRVTGDTAETVAALADLVSQATVAALKQGQRLPL